MKPNKSDSDDDKYIPSGFLNSMNQTIGSVDMKTKEIAEFYNEGKLNEVELEKKLSPPVLCELSDSCPSREKRVFESHSSTEGRPSMEKHSSVPKGRFLSIPPERKHQASLQMDARTPARLPIPGAMYHNHSVQFSQLMHPSVHQAVHVPLHPMIPQPSRRMLYPPRPHPYAYPGVVPIRMIQQPQVCTHYAPVFSHCVSQALHPISMYPTMASSPVVPSRLFPSTSTISQSTFSSTVLPSNIIGANLHAHTMHPISPLMHPGALFSPQMIAISQQIPEVSQSSEKTPLEFKPALSENHVPIETPEVRRRRKAEALAKAKEEREVFKAAYKAKRDAERAEALMKRESAKKNIETPNKKFVNFAKDMFVIRLKDVDSLERDTEVWRIDNHILIQKFSPIPSLRLPALQFQSTNRMSGYDSRAAWRFFIIDSKCVKVDKSGSIITVHEFPSLATLREAKKLAELKDEEFKNIEQDELREKFNKLEAKKMSKIAEKLRRRSERKEKRAQEKLSWSSIKTKSWQAVNEPLDEDVCRNIMNGLLDALEDDDFDYEDIYTTSEEELSFSDEDEVGSLRTIAHSTDTEDDEDDDTPFELYDENEVPEVALELIVD